MSNKIQAIILAAGRSSRFNTINSKLTFRICGQEMIIYPIKALIELNISYSLVLGYQKEPVLTILNNYKLNFTYVEQLEQKGTGHALTVTKDLWVTDNILVLNGDMPLVNSKILNKLIEKHIESDAAISFLAAQNLNDSGYGRVVHENNRIKIVEARDFKDDVNKYSYINAGVYLIKKEFLNEYLNKLELHSNSQEFYITDLIYIASQNNKKIELIEIDFDYVRGVNTLEELSIIEKLKQKEIILNHMHNGVRFLMPENTSVDINVTIGNDTVIGQGAQLKNSSIGSGCFIDSYSIIDNSKICDYAVVKPYSIISQSIINERALIGPFANIKNYSLIESDAVIGNFVEVKNSKIGAKTKAKHLSYIGDAQIGNNVNIGAGLVTCNYDGISKKNKTLIEDGASIGANTSLVAPISIGKNSFVAAGSTVTENVPDQALAIARSRQINKEQYAQKLRAKSLNLEDTTKQVENL